MKLNDIDLNLLSEDDLRRLCLKYDIITIQEVNSFDKERLLKETRSFIIHKMKKYKSRPRSFSQPNISYENKGENKGKNKGQIKVK